MDEVERDFRSLAIKLFDGERPDALDLVMNTGHVQGFWHAANFLRGAIGGVLGEWGRRWYILSNPPAYENVLAGIRRAPKSFTQLSYYAAISFGLTATDGTQHLVRFRVIPLSREPDDGVSTDEDLQRPWFEGRSAGEDRTAGWLRAEYAARLRSGNSARYILQTQVRPHTDDHQAYNIGRAWDEADYPWSDLAHLTLDRLLPAATTESLLFRIDNQPSCLRVPEAQSPWDYRSIGWMRPRVYRWLQGVRTVSHRVYRAFGWNSVPCWDRVRAAERRVWRRPRGHTLLLKITHQPNELLTELLRVGDAIGKLPEAAFHHIETLHFFRMQVVEIPDPHILIDWVFDGPLNAHLDEFLLHVGPWFEELIRRHVDSSRALRTVLQENPLSAQTFHSGDVTGTARDVLQEQRLREVVEAFVDRQIAAGGWPPEASPESIRQTIRYHVLSLTDSRLPTGPRPGRSIVALMHRWLDAVCALTSPWSGILRTEIRKWLLPAGGRSKIPWRIAAEFVMAAHYFWTMLPSAWLMEKSRRLEEQEAVTSEPPSIDHLTDIIRREEFQSQNPLTMICEVEDKSERGWLLATVLRGADQASRHIWNTGHLAGIRTIHCARFLLFDGGHRLLFLSDYDGSWERYLNDFVSVGNVAVVPIFTNLVGCPPTRNLFDTTPGFGERFLAFTRRNQTQVHLWYSAWPTLSLSNRLANARLREGLFARAMTDSAALNWLQETL